MRGQWYKAFLQYGLPSMVDVSVQGILSEVEGSVQMTSLN
jgi:hypothetical protein